MKIKNNIKSLVALMLAIVMLFAVAGCSKGGTSSDRSPSGGSGDEISTEEGGLLPGVDYEKAYGGYDEPVTIKLGVWQRETDKSYDKSPFLDLLKEKFNIIVEFDWILPWEQHVEKVNMSINAGTLPDAATVYSNQAVKSLLENNSILDLTPYREYFGNYLSASYSSFENDSCLAEVSSGGKLGALPSTAIGYQHEVLWIRKDWLEVVGLDVPTTLDEVINVAKAFVSQDPDQNGKDDTFGIPFSSYAFGVDNNNGTIDPLFAAMGSFPRAWLKGADGKTVYGSTTAETKNALAKLSELCASKVIFCSQDNNGANTGNGKCGMIFGAWWCGDGLKASFDSNPDANWIAVSAPLDSNGKYCIPQEKAALDVNGHLIFGPNSEHPEAVIKMLNISWALTTKGFLPDGVYERYEELCANYEEGSWAFPIFQQIATKTSIIDNNKKLLEAVKKEDPSKLTGQGLVHYDAIMKYNEDIYSCTATEWQDAVNHTIGVPAANSDKLTIVPVNATDLPTEYSGTYSKLIEMENQFFYEIITGIKTIDAFDNMVSNFKTMGGNDILAYIDSQK